MPSSLVADAPRPVWHVICSTDLLALLRRVYLQEYVNADREEVE